MSAARFEDDRYLPARDASREGALCDDDAEAIARTLAGEREAFESVVRRHEQAVYTMLLRMTRNADDAQELAQEAFLRAYRSLNKFDRTKPFRPWILRIAANAATEHGRKRSRARLVALDGEEEAERLADARTPDARDRYGDDQERALLRRAVESLRDNDAELFHLHYDEDLTVEEIAESLGKRPNTVSVALHRLRQQIKDLVKTFTGKDG